MGQFLELKRDLRATAMQNFNAVTAVVQEIKNDEDPQTFTLEGYAKISFAYRCF